MTSMRTNLRPRGSLDEVKNERTEELKQLLPAEKWDLLYLFESHTVEECGNELRRFADFVARLLMGSTYMERDGADGTGNDGA